MNPKLKIFSLFEYVINIAKKLTIWFIFPDRNCYNLGFTRLGSDFSNLVRQSPVINRLLRQTRLNETECISFKVLIADGSINLNYWNMFV